MFAKMFSLFSGSKTKRSHNHKKRHTRRHKKRYTRRMRGG